MQLNYKIVNGILHFSWDEDKNAHHYRIMGMSETFVYISIATISELKYNLDIDEYGSYLRFKVIAESESGSVLAESNEITIACLDIEKFDITALEGYNGITLAFRSKGVYDLYRVYSQGELIAETEDPVLELSCKFTKNQIGKISVEGYRKNGDEYILGGISKEIAKLPERKKSDYKISVIIPVYNAQVFLPRTVDSILSSSISDIEIVLMDDGSRDNSPAICDWYTKKYPCVSVVHQTNQGVAATRNNGVSIVKSEYLAFVDSDDIVHPFMYEKLYNACKSEKTDIAIATTIIRNSFGDKKLCLDMPNKKENVIVYSYDEVMKNKHNKDNMYYVAVWNKIVKTKIARKTAFPMDWPTNVVLYEDCAYTASLYSYIDRFALCKDAYYVYDKRKQNTVGSYSVMYKNRSNDDIWKAFIYAYSYPIYNRYDKHKELSDYTNFQRLIESYDKFKTPSPMLDYWNEKLTELINKQKLFENNLIMRNEHLKNVVSKLRK